MFEALNEKTETSHSFPEIPQGFPWRDYDYKTKPENDSLALSEFSETDIATYDLMVEQLEKPIEAYEEDEQSQIEAAEAYETASEMFVSEGFYLKGALLKSKAAAKFAKYGRLGTAERLYSEAIALDYKTFELNGYGEIPEGEDIFNWKKNETVLTRSLFPNIQIEIGQIENPRTRLAPTGDSTIFQMLIYHYYMLLETIRHRSDTNIAKNYADIVRKRGISDLYRMNGLWALNREKVERKGKKRGVFYANGTSASETPMFLPWNQWYRKDKDPTY